MTSWHASKYDSLIVLQNDAANNSLWHSDAENTPRNSDFATTHTKGEAHVPMPSFKCPHGSIDQSSHGTQNEFEGNGSKGASNSKITWGHLKDAKSNFKSPSKSYIFD